MSTRKVRSDKGSRRKPEPTAYESWRDTFAGFPAERQDRAIEDCELMRRTQRLKPRMDEEAVEQRTEAPFESL